jgi:hypothetical protein
MFLEKELVMIIHDLIWLTIGILVTPGLPILACIGFWYIEEKL